VLTGMVTSPDGATTLGRCTDNTKKRRLDSALPQGTHSSRVVAQGSAACWSVTGVVAGGECGGSADSGVRHANSETVQAKHHLFDETALH
jgi:hypothetical protein